MESMCHCYTWMQQILFPAPSYRKFAPKINSNFISNIKFSILFQKVKNYFCGLVRRVDLGSQKPRISSLDRVHFITVAWLKSNSQKRFNNVEKHFVYPSDFERFVVQGILFRPSGQESPLANVSIYKSGLLVVFGNVAIMR